MTEAPVLVISVYSDAAKEVYETAKELAEDATGEDLTHTDAVEHICQVYVASTDSDLAISLVSDDVREVYENAKEVAEADLGVESLTHAQAINHLSQSYVGFPDGYWDENDPDWEVGEGGSV